MRTHALALTLLGLVLAFPRSAAAGPAPSPTPRAATKQPLRVGRFFVGDEAGTPRRTFYTVEPAVYFYAFVANPGAARTTPSAAAPATADMPSPATPAPSPAPPPRFELTVRDPLGHEVARLGGPFAPDLSPGSDLPRGCTSTSENGVRIANGPLADRPGRYLVTAQLNGAPAGQRWFTVQPLRNDGQIALTSACVENAQGQRRRTFTTRDRGVYAHVTFVNQTRDRAHEHLVQVIFWGPHGPVGRPLGGVLRLREGTRLDGRDFPAFIDAARHDGLRIEKTPIAARVGPWKMVVYVDGKAVREVAFRLVVDARDKTPKPSP